MIVAVVLILWMLGGCAVIGYGIGNVTGWTAGRRDGYNEGWDNCRAFYGVEGDLEDELQEIIREEGEAH